MDVPATYSQQGYDITIARDPFSSFSDANKAEYCYTLLARHQQGRQLTEQQRLGNRVRLEYCKLASKGSGNGGRGAMGAIAPPPPSNSRIKGG